ncbi:MAG: AMP-dependent synthetase/ligase [Promethearchaeota archaeon]
MMFYDDVFKLIQAQRKKQEEDNIPVGLETKVNLVQQFRKSVRENGEQPALMARHLDEWGNGYWVTKTYNEFAASVDALAASLIESGVKIGTMVTLQSHTREEWAIIDEAILGTGGVTVCIYPSLAPSMVEYQLDDSGTEIAFMETITHAINVKNSKEKLPKLKLVIMIDDPRGADPNFEMPDWMVTYKDYLQKGGKILEENPGLHDEIIQMENKIDPDSLATIIYTSGTTGMPKGAMLTHWNIASNCIAVYYFSALYILKRNLSFLPLSHSLERMSGHFYPIMAGMCTAFASNIDNLSRDLQEVKPDYLTGVPRVFEKIYAYAMLTVNKYSKVKQKIFWWAVKVGKEYGDKFRAQEKISPGLKLKIKIARALVFKKFVMMTGGELLFFISGGASMPEELARFYGAVGLTIIEGYGLTETSPVTNMNDPLNIVFGAVGPPIPGTEIKLAEDGEILVKGPQVFQGYLNKPDKTREVLEESGWFHTGDLGSWDDRGNLKIIGRKKEIFVLSTGKKVPPIMVEDLVAMVQFIQQLILTGDGHKYITALITPNFDYLREYLKQEMPEIAGKMPDPAKSPDTEVEAFLYLPAVHELFEKDIDKINANVDPFSQIKKFEIIPHEFTEESGDLTPSLKFRRKAISEHYKDKIEKMYKKDVSEELSVAFEPDLNE